MTIKSLLIYVLIFVILTNLETTESAENLENMFVKRCDSKLAKDKSQQYDKCDAEASDTIKETVKSCAQDNCNKDGKFDQLDVCCYAIKPNAMFACFEKTVLEKEANEAKAKKVSKDELHKKNSHNAAKIVECYEEIDD